MCYIDGCEGYRFTTVKIDGNEFDVCHKHFMLVKPSKHGINTTEIVKTQRQKKLAVSNEQTKDIQKLIMADRLVSNHMVACPNIATFSAWEFDVMTIAMNGDVYEYEVKRSKADFQKDKKKSGKLSKYTMKAYERMTPNFFIYVCPESLISETEVPEYAGLVYVKEDGILVTVKKPVKLHNTKHDIPNILKKVARLYQERYVWGVSKLTYENGLVKQKNKQRIEEQDRKWKEIIERNRG